jgi:hypothetical protein
LARGDANVEYYLPETWYWHVNGSEFRGGFVVFVNFDSRVESHQMRFRHNKFIDDFKRQPALAFIPFTIWKYIDARSSTSIVSVSVQPFF